MKGPWVIDPFATEIFRRSAFRVENSDRAAVGTLGNNPNSQNVQSVTVEQSSVYGPDCNFTFNMGGSTYVIHAQQDFCSSEGGDVTASVVSGNAVITGTSSGSYQNSSGSVNVTLN